MKRPVFLLAGGDLRQLYAAQELARNGTAYVLGFDADTAVPAGVICLEGTAPTIHADYLVLPMPCSEDSVWLTAPFSRHKIALSGLPAMLRSGGLTFGGRMSSGVRQLFTDAGIEAIDYFAREETSVRNAIPTAEGAIQIAMEELATTIYGLRILLIGYGRIAKVLARILLAMGARVTVAARSCADRAWAEQDGCETIHTNQLTALAASFDLIYNTAPALLLDAACLRTLQPDTLIIDLASKPGGVDFETASACGVKVVWALSLPGKYAPITAGQIIAGTICNILEERRLANA